MNNSMPTNLITQMNRTSSLKDTICSFKITKGRRRNRQSKQAYIYKEIELIISNLLKQKAPDPVGSLVNSTKHLRKKFLSILYNLFQKIETERILPNSFYKASITLIPKSDKNITRKVNYRLISVMNTDAKIFNKTLAN